MAAEETILSLASLAARTAVASATTDGWAMVKAGLARLFGRGDATRTQFAERRLEQAREQLADAGSEDLGRVQEELVAAWQTRILDLLEEHPEVVAELQMLVEQIQGRTPTQAVSAAGHAVVAGRDVAITASRGGIAAGTVYGDVRAGNPTGPGLAGQ